MKEPRHKGYLLHDPPHTHTHNTQSGEPVETGSRFVVAGEWEAELGQAEN